MSDIVVKEDGNLIQLFISGVPRPITITKLEACKIMHEIENILKIDKMIEEEQEELTPCDFFESACQQMIWVDPAEKRLEFCFYQDILNAFKNYRVKHENSPFTSDEMP